MDRDTLHDIYRRWRAIADSYPEPRLLVGEVWLPGRGALARYLRPDELHTAFNFDFLACPWEPGPMRTSIESALAAHAPVDAPTTWVLSNHDVTRPVTRYGRTDTSFSFESKREAHPPTWSAAPGAREQRRCSRWRYRARCTSTRAKSSACRRSRTSRPIVRQDPMWHRSGGVDPGRDGCRIPLPWDGDRPPYGFSREGADRPWLDQPVDWARLTVEAQSEIATSMLSLYRTGLRIRRAAPWSGDAAPWWIPPPSRSSRSRAPSVSPASSISARTRSRCPPAPKSSSRATSSKEVSSRKTPRSGFARRRIGSSAPCRPGTPHRFVNTDRTGPSVGAREKEGR